MSNLQTLAEVRAALEKIEKKRKAKKKTRKCLYSTFSHDYKKFDWSSDYIESRDLMTISKGSAIGVQRKARDLKKIKVCKKRQGKSYYSKMNIKGMFLLQE